MSLFPVNLDDALAEGFCRQMMSLARLGGAPDGSVTLVGRAARAVSRATSMGHVCLRLGDWLETEEPALLREARALLLDSGLVGSEGQDRPLPLVLDSDDRLYLGRYFDYEQRLAATLLAQATPMPASVGDDDLDAGRLAAVFQGAGARAGVDWQRLAVALALRNRLTVITGGPGTGKTTTVVNLLACLLAKDPGLRIILAAPTGKAAQRMQDAIRDRASHLPEALRRLLPSDSFTIHRLLGVIADSDRFRHHRANLLTLDVLVIDEASMLDLALAAKLLEAVPAQARVILLGDKDQLAAVEAGAVFAEISSQVAYSEPCRQQLARLTGIPAAAIRGMGDEGDSPLPDTVVWFTENHRFGRDSGIGQLARAINDGEAEAALRCLASGVAGVGLVEDDGQQLAPAAMSDLAAGFDDYLACLAGQGTDPGAVFEALGRYRILAALRDSERGVEWLNRQVSTVFRQRLRHSLDDGRTPWYPGRPILILRNDYVLKLFNGDIGIILPNADGRLMAYFPASDGSYRALAPLRLPPHETAFAMTVHKAQGSEFEGVAIVLPAYSSAVLTRELLYTAVTRSRQRLIVYAAPSIVQEAVSRRCLRHSGLSRRLAAGRQR